MTKKIRLRWKTALHSWSSLQNCLMLLSIDELKEMLAYERKNKNRITIIKRLIQRLNKALADSVKVSQ